MDKEEVITHDSKVQDGKPCIRDTGVPVWKLVRHMMDVHKAIVLKTFPELTPVDLAEAWKFFALNPQRVVNDLEPKEHAQFFRPASSVPDLMDYYKSLTKVEEAEPEGRKFDDDKLRWDLVQPLVLQEYVKVLTHGAKKYAPDNWRKVPDQRSRYFAALLRHVWAWWLGEKYDPDSGLHHVGHAICCIAFLTEPELEKAQLPPEEMKIARTLEAAAEAMAAEDKPVCEKGKRSAFGHCGNAACPACSTQYGTQEE